MNMNMNMNQPKPGTDIEANLGGGRMNDQSQHSDSSAPEDTTHHGEDDLTAKKEKVTTLVSEAERERQTLAKKETRMVRYLRFLVLGVLLIVAVVVTAGVYLYARNDEEDAFEANFYSHATKLLETLESSVEDTMMGLDVLSTAVTSQVLLQQQTFPNISIPHFETLGSNARVLTDGAMLFLMPYVDDTTRAGYEAYRMENYEFLEAIGTPNAGPRGQSWERETKLRELQNEEYNIPNAQAPPNATAYPLIPHLYGRRPQQAPNLTLGEAIPEGLGPYFPIAHISPTTTWNPFAMINLDYASFLPTLLLPIPLTKQAGMSPFVPLDSYLAQVANSYLSSGQYRGNSQAYVGDASSFIAYPVFDSFDKEARQVKAVLTLVMLWRNKFRGGNSEGLVAVMSDTFNHTMTYQIVGSTVTLLGEGDLHDLKYNDMTVTAKVGAYVQAHASPETRSLTAAELNTVYSDYTLSIYPSELMEDAYITNTPWVFTAVVASIFLFTTFVFFVFDFYVEARQKEVLNRAVQSSAIVSTLFPENVTKRLRDQTKATKKEQPVGKGAAWKIKNNEPQSSSLEGGGAHVDNNESGNERIADVYKDTTVFFADLAGFTSWSAKHTPGEVFEMLELIYANMDSIALNRGVYKVETIGDCYMAVTGLPQPQANHAERMVKFSRDALNKLKRLQEKPQYAHLHLKDLQFRVGMHSGPVTAGVIRGDRARFQLFGDTVNTASRMESNGMPERIHCSQATANVLTAAGKGNWLTPREDKIEAKGKGLMQTYYVEIPTARGSVATSSGYHTGTSFASSTDDNDDENDDDIRMENWPEEEENNNLDQSLDGVNQLETDGTTHEKAQDMSFVSC